MNKKNLVLAMANPVPEILPDVAKKVIKNLVIIKFYFLNYIYIGWCVYNGYW